VQLRVGAKAFDVIQTLAPGHWEEAHHFSICHSRDADVKHGKIE
jgi:hypothetical protein